MRRRLFCCITVGVNLVVLASANAGHNNKWELEERSNFIFILSYKQSATINDRIATSELAFLCDQKNRVGIVGTILVPFDGTFESHQDPVPMSIQKKSDEYGPSDLIQKWKNGSDFLFSDVTDDVADLIALLKEKDTESDKSVHFYFPSGPDNGKQTSDHVVVDAFRVCREIRGI
jgi:hypothetical protein